MIRRLAAALAAASLLAAAPVQAEACLTPPEAEAIALVVMPDVLKQTGVVCAARLSPGSPLRAPSGPLIARYDREAERAWPAARAAIVRMSMPEVELLLGSDFARPIVSSLVAPLVVGRIAPADCGLIDRLVRLLAPLPPTNIAAILVTLLQHLRAERARGKDVGVPNLPLCEAP